VQLLCAAEDAVAVPREDDEAAFRFAEFTLRFAEFSL
jgi:hypothetical protein